MKGEVVMRQHGEDEVYDGECSVALYALVLLLVGLGGVGLADLLGLLVH